MNWVDLVILGVFVFYTVEGLRRGFIEQTLELLGFFITIFFAFISYKPFAVWLTNNTGIEGFGAQPIAFLLLWVIYQVVYSFILQVLYPLIPEKYRATAPNRLAGTVPALFKAFIFISVLLTLVVALPVPAKLKSAIDTSAIGSRFVSQSGNIQQYLSKITGRDIKNTLTFLTVPPQTEEIIQPDERVTLKFTYSEGTVDKQAEQEMFVLVNKERAKVGLKQLVWSEKVAETARKHASDMLEKGYFSHENLEGMSPFDRMERDSIVFKTAGENLAYAATVDLAHNGLMRSPGHRANILEVDFGTIGIGIIDAGIYGKMFTQNFTD
ncbi:MAG: CvpA family protein [Candidatus Berkelbacteria bacterium]|nr:MAG: CvpA family protein [Candidatus Berkelbacteria bacterium]QQG51566.1 MAG: CvpA family protein [Candidatus Berkelbacteria bacterium]